MAESGEYDKALDVVEAALKDAPRGSRLLARQAELLYLRGRWDDAEKAADAAVDASKPERAHFLGPLGPRPGLPRPRRHRQGRRGVPLVRPLPTPNAATMTTTSKIPKSC